MKGGGAATWRKPLRGAGVYAKARRAQAVFPDVGFFGYFEMRALAALGRLEEFNARIDRAMAEESIWAAGYLGVLIPELQAHGNPEASVALARRCVEWIGTLSSVEAARARPQLAQCLSAVGRYDEAASIYRAIIRETGPNTVPDLRGSLYGSLGRLAARRGDREEAERLFGESQLHVNPAVYGEERLLMRQAGIAALLGDRDRAISLLRELVGGGTQYMSQLHWRPYFKSLWEDPAFQELVRPKG